MVTEYDAPLSAKVLLREDITRMKSIKCLDSSLNSCFVGATTNGTLICFDFNESIGEEIFLDADASSVVQSPLEQYWSGATSITQASPRLESLLRNAGRLERREEREVAASELVAAADDARNISQTIQEVCRYGQRKRVRVRQEVCRGVANMVEELQKDK